VPTFGHDTIQRFRQSVSELKRMAAHDFEDLLQVSLTSPSGKCVFAIFQKRSHFWQKVLLLQKWQKYLFLKKIATLLMHFSLHFYIHFSCLCNTLFATLLVYFYYTCCRLFGALLICTLLLHFLLHFLYTFSTLVADICCTLGTLLLHILFTFSSSL
ncbi:hypothetical protein HYDPIDRAFT_91247, partial [Hydnomerulius pinastri MD-312]